MGRTDTRYKRANTTKTTTATAAIIMLFSPWTFFSFFLYVAIRFLQNAKNEDERA
jgi:hypothetical protein